MSDKDAAVFRIAWKSEVRPGLDPRKRAAEGAARPEASPQPSALSGRAIPGRAAGSVAILIARA